MKLHSVKNPTYLVLPLLLVCFCGAQAANRYMNLTGAGSKDGSSWTNAYPSSGIQNVLNTIMAPGDTLYLEGANYGDLRPSINTSGTVSAPKSLVGVNLGAGLPLFRGTQAVRSYTGISLAAGSGYWTIKNVMIESRDIGLSASGAPGIILDGISVRHVRSACYSMSDADGVLIQNCRADRYNELGFMFSSACDGVTVKNCVADCSGTGSVPDPAFRLSAKDPVGFNFHYKQSTAPFNTNILLEDCEALNNDEDTASTTDYEQGDGFKMESSNDGLTLRRCKSHHNQDGAVDLKGSNQVLEDCISYSNGRYGFKIWYQGTLTNCLAVDNGSWAFQCPATTGGHTITATNCTFHTPNYGINATTGNTVNLSNCLITLKGATGTYTSGGTINLNVGLPNETKKHANASNPANAPQYINPVSPWNGVGNNYDNLTYGLGKGYNSTLVGGGPVSIVIDNNNAFNSGGSAASSTGAWTTSTAATGYYGLDYQHDGNLGKGTKTFTFTPNLPTSGSYNVFMRWTSGTNRANNVPVNIDFAGGNDPVQVNQQANNNVWMLLGTYSCNAGTGQKVVVSTTGTNGFVIADAVKFEK